MWRRHDPPFRYPQRNVALPMMRCEDQHEEHGSSDKDPDQPGPAGRCRLAFWLPLPKLCIKSWIDPDFDRMLMYFDFGSNRAGMIRMVTHLCLKNRKLRSKTICHQTSVHLSKVI